ncbi:MULTISPECIES: hypothetical protein [Xanthomarina]|uniref:Uncharacterized protein n=2 Tax=Xanthomarina gelatinilytica TaxID=1137281 RepID=A0A3D6BPE3_9FLAO|nr:MULTISPECIES: hypothetical protein [Xanthomarina]MCB0389365.1 hypothetical protein [Winogradskyella sp.]MAL23042.1 hypothetical protein [Xanthomarina sp.]MBF61777.1 hypothetical protein [Xanthomarina sp.]HAB27158.1 hypothetical protein [Xanthomarina gelatinilytica]HAI16758.1 hypothetical protein [Xanthomarina gelatinilytica]
MKSKITLFCLTFFLMVGIGTAQNKDAPKSIISQDVSISKYHDRKELEQMQKGALLGLYNERIEIIIKILPYIAFATKPGVTMSTFGIPDTKDNRNALDTQIEATTNYFQSTMDFQNKILPYSDRANLIAAILFYEETLKALHIYSENNRF